MSVASSTALARLLAAPERPARVLGASPAAVYLAVDGGGVVAVVAAAAVRLPIAVVLPGEVPPPERVAVGGGGVDLGAGRMCPDAWFDPRPVLGGPALAGSVAAARRLLAAAGADAAGLDPGLADAVAGGLRAGDAVPALGLLGRGPGLTPAGDDLVAGAIAGLILLGGGELAAAAAVVAEAPRATTLLSAALLECAARGQVLPEAAGLLRALAGEGALQPSLTDLLDIGATSGPALALGLCAAAGAVLRGSSPAVGGGAPPAG